MKRFAGRFWREGWKIPMMMYSFKCPEHGLVISHECGFNNYLVCPVCVYHRNEKEKENEKK